MRRSLALFSEIGRFSNQVSVVTGGARGLGLGIAQRLGKEGSKLVLVDVDAVELEKVAKQFKSQGIQTIGIKTDVTKEAEVQAAVKESLKQFGQIDVLVQAAGITGKTGIKTEDVQVDDFKRVYDINVNGVFYFCKAVLPHFVARNYGRIINIASVSGKDGNAGMLAYSSSKAAVIGMTKVMGKEYAETGITINALAPAVVRTAMVAAMPAEQVKYMTDKIPMKRTGEVEEIAALVAFIASKEASFTTAFTFDATGGRATY
eukprot:TRINITY_DN11738_c0_g1_i1.p1 TRINITY_DN11738_c0_g1~~TRINITY_DN11738_c0_g1_i1.p1  ORF type:complete len:261 (-),score=62.71 TRINITY_DN11738_c0_g1_i1:507-1289(-)